MKYDAVIFDLGNTLVSYYTNAEWPGVLAECIDAVAERLRERGLLTVDPAGLAPRAEAERGTPDDYRVVPLEERLVRIFDLGGVALAADVMPEMSRLFTRPIFARARLHDDVPPALAELHRRGLKTGILSNMPWGCPAILWREELDRHRLLTAVDAAAFCRDCGYRKPAPQAFEFITGKLGVAMDRCLFVGDDPRWDIAGPHAIGMDAVLIDRRAPEDVTDAGAIRDLPQLLDRF
jgi:HAD superfamily hydrolase (TIGR01662 family)